MATLIGSSNSSWENVLKTYRKNLYTQPHLQMGIFRDFNSGFDTEQRLAHACIFAQNQGYTLYYISFDKYNMSGYLTLY